MSNVKPIKEVRDELANLYVFYLSEGMSKTEAYLKVHPQHEDKGIETINSLRYAYEQSKYVKDKLVRLNTETYLLYQNEHFKALRKQYEIGMGLHGGSLKTQADALHQFIGNTMSPNSKVEETTDKIVNEQQELLRSITKMFDNIGKEFDNQEVVLDTEVYEQLTEK